MRVEASGVFNQNVGLAGAAAPHTLWNNKMRLLFSLLAISALLAPQLAQAMNPTPAIAQIDAAVAKEKHWLRDAARCPVSLIPKRQTGEYLMGDSCTITPGICMMKCKAGKGGSCYWLAYAVQQGGGKPQTSEALFQRACKLGVVSGCTNRAAGMVAHKPSDESVLRCAVRTYKKTCALDEPWGCTWYALHLARGIGVKADPAAALRVLNSKTPCKYGKNDQACRNAMALKAQLLRGPRASSSQH